MKRLVILLLMICPMLASAQTVSNVQNSGCLSETRGAESQRVPTIILTKEGSTLSVQLLDYESDCCTEDFNVTFSIASGSNYDVCEVSISPISEDCDCVCPYNVSFTVRDLAPNEFYLYCWWYKGMVNLTEGEPLVLEYKVMTEDVMINETNFPDENFRNYLLSQKYGKDGVLTEEEIAEITKIEIPPYSECKNLQGIEFFTALKELDCHFTLVTSLDMSNNTELQSLTCYVSGIETLNVSNNKKLSYLNCSDTKLTSLDVSGCTALNWLACEENELTELDVSKNTALERLICYDNQLTSLNVSGCTALTRINCGDNQLTSLDVSGCTELTDLYCSKNKIKGEAMDALVESLPTVSEGRMEVIYFKDEQNAMTTSQVAAAKAKGWTPIYWTYYEDWQEYAGSEPKESHYYYYNGKKIPLTLNENKVIVSIPKECDSTSKRIRANVSVLSTIQDKVFDIFIIPRSDFERLTSQNFWEEDAKSVVLTSSYYTEGNKEVYETPYLNVKLKKEEDANLLDSYAEKYKLKNLGSFSQNLPLWYILHVTPDSDKSPLECANELYESGYFASSVPDFASDNVIELPYRQFVEEGKVWKVGIWSGNPVRMVEYFYFDGDTIVGGKACKRMWCQQYGNEGSWYFDGLYRGEEPNKQLYYIGVFYEEDKKVYFQPWEDQLGGLYANDFWLLYDFSVMPGDTIFDYVMTAKASGGMPEFKGTYYDLTPYTEPKEYEEPLWNNRWLEGVGRADVPYYNLYNGETGHYTFLMSCTVGDEVIYLDDQYEDGATPSMETKKRRFDFTHTVKIQPKTPSRRGEETALYGEYNDKSLDIRLDPLDAAYSVCITNQKTGETLYEKNINAGSIVALNIDISKYAEGQYKISIDNSNETFNGVFDTSATEINEIMHNSQFIMHNDAIFNLQGQRINGLQKGLNIVDGKKILVK